jgi:phage-related protein
MVRRYVVHLLFYTLVDRKFASREAPRGYSSAGSRSKSSDLLGGRAGDCKFIAKKVYCYVTWSFVFLNAEVKAELNALAEDTRASFERIVRLVQTVGLERVHEPYIKHIEDRIWEIRLRGRGGIARDLYVTATGRRVVILRVFVKKTQKTPRREIELARQRAKEVT